uniref:Uncharacterized protein n=1 Tax=Anguilla anguilla TaxID=7936 RepID=A0A0E9WA09_ANGAN
MYADSSIHAEIYSPTFHHPPTSLVCTCLSNLPQELWPEIYPHSCIESQVVISMIHQ